MATLESSFGVTPYVASVSESPAEESLRETRSVPSLYLRFRESPDTVIEETFPFETLFATCESAISCGFVDGDAISVYKPINKRNTNTVDRKLPVNDVLKNGAGFFIWRFFLLLLLFFCLRLSFGDFITFYMHNYTRHSP